MSGVSHEATTGPASADGVRARDAFRGGDNCAEAVLAAFEGAGPDMPSGIGAGFTQGIGGSGCVCGALTAAVMAISAGVAAEGLEPQAAHARAEALAQELHARFKRRWGSTCCRVLKRGQLEGSDAWISGCAEITEYAAATAVDLLGTAAPARRWARLDVLAAARRTALDALALIGLAGLAAALTRSDGATLVVVAIGAALVGGALLEGGTTSTRRIARLIRAAGIACAAVFALVSVITPGAAAAVVASLFGPAAMAVSARVLIVALPLFTGAMALLDFKRYR